MKMIAANLPIGELGTLFIGVCMKNSMVENAKVFLGFLFQEGCKNLSKQSICT